MVGRAAPVGLAILAIVAVPAGAGARADHHRAHGSGCARGASHRRDRCRRARHRHRRVATVAPSAVAAPSPTSPDANPAPNPWPGDTTPPRFAGLQSAFACTPGPQRPGQTTPFNLSWEGAVDDVTPPAQIIYDVYLATEAGGEDFAHPTWSTEPGVTSFRTPGLASHGSFYFVVRARDAAGNEDDNLVERHGVDPCL
jgi:hypothetical protein